MTKWMIFSVLAGAYKGKSADLKTCLTHMATVDDSEQPIKAACRTNVDNLIDSMPLGDGPTCPKCRARWLKIT